MNYLWAVLGYAFAILCIVAVVALTGVIINFVTCDVLRIFDCQTARACLRGLQ